MTKLHTAFHPRISSPHAHKGTDRVGAPFLGKSVCAAMSWLTGMAGGELRRKNRFMYALSASFGIYHQIVLARQRLAFSCQTQTRDGTCFV